MSAVPARPAQLDYAKLTRTPSGALTAASKRAVEAECVELEVFRRELNRLAQAKSEAFQELSEATELYEANGGDTDTRPLTDREQRLCNLAAESARAATSGDAVEELIDIVEGEIAELRLRQTLGLDEDLTALEILERAVLDIRADPSWYRVR